MPMRLEVSGLRRLGGLLGSCGDLLDVCDGSVSMLLQAMQAVGARIFCESWSDCLRALSVSHHWEHQK